MLTKNLDITYAMVWSIAIANILGSGLCFLFSGQFAKLATLRYTLILPVVLCLVYIGAFEGKREWGDLYSLLFFGLLGWALKHFKWPRPPLVLGFILGEMLERYMFISIQRYGWIVDAAAGRHRDVRHDGCSACCGRSCATSAHAAQARSFPASPRPGWRRACCSRRGSSHSSRRCWRPPRPGRSRRRSSR